MSILIFLIGKLTYSHKFFMGCKKSLHQDLSYRSLNYGTKATETKAAKNMVVEVMAMEFVALEVVEVVWTIYCTNIEL